MDKWNVSRRAFPFGISTWLLLAVVSTIVLALAGSPIAPLPGSITMLLVPGSVLMDLLNVRPKRISSRVVLAVCLSLMLIMVVGGICSLLGPHVGVSHPLDETSQYVTWSVIGIVILISCYLTGRDPVSSIADGIESKHLVYLLIGGLLVTLSILGVARLNHSGDNSIAVISLSLDILALLVGVFGGWRRTSRWPLSLILYVATLSLLLSTSLRGGHLYGWDVQQEFGVASQTVAKGLWSIPINHDPYASMLSLTVLPAILHSVVRLHLTSFFEIVVPAILALLPVAMLSAASGVPRWVERRRLSPRPGLALGVVAAIVISSEVFPIELVTISRQAMALTMLAALVMVILDGSITVRNSRITIGILLLAISFTHYSTSYLLAGIFLIWWLAGMFWKRGWLVVPNERILKHRTKASSKQIINLSLVAIALITAFGWNLGITRNNALRAPSGAILTSGFGLSASAGSQYISASKLEKILIKELHVSAKWIVPIPNSRTVHLVTSTAPSSPGVAPHLEVWWNRLIIVAHDSLWVLGFLALLYGGLLLERRRSKGYTSDLACMAVAGLVVGATLRLSGTLAEYYSPERGAIVAAILLVVPITLFFDDIAARVSTISLVVGLFATAVLTIWSTGIGVLFFGGQAPASIVSRGENDERFIVSTPELATAIWLRNELGTNSFVQTDYLGQLVLLSEPGRYGLVPEIIPPGVDQRAYIYLSTTNLIQRRSRADVDDGRYLAVYESNIKFFNHNFYVVYSTGTTRVYHR